MTTEILGFIIILGAVIVLLARQHLNKSEDDPEVLEAATGRLRYELEQDVIALLNIISGRCFPASIYSSWSLFLHIKVWG